MNQSLQIMPLGGLGRIGMNCMLVGHRDRWIMVDCGSQFADAHELGADKKLHDLDLFDAYANRIEAIVITHGHEDHIGGLPWILPRLHDVPIYATAFTRELIAKRLKEYALWKDDLVTLFEPGDPVVAGPFDVEGVRVTHSLPDCVALVLRCEDGTIVHTGDWKIDEQPMDGEHFDRAAFERIGKEGVNLLLCDSTNILSPGWTRSERVVADNILQTIEGHPGRVVVAQFASNLHRLRGLVEAAEATDRQIVFCGRSLESYLECASRVGRAPLDPGKVIGSHRLQERDPAKTIVVTTGSQGERRSALARASVGQHPHFKIDASDLILHSARIIPGSESAVYAMFNNLARHRATTMLGRDTGIHASGHAKQDEIAELYRLLKPQHVVPVHGEYTFLLAQQRFALAQGIPKSTLVNNGEKVAVVGEAGGHTHIDRVDYQAPNYFYSNGLATGDRDDMRLSERKRMAWNGVLAAHMVLRRRDDGGWAADIRLQRAGLWIPEEDTLDAMVKTATAAVAACPAATPVKEVEDVCRVALRRYAKKCSGQKPVVMLFTETPAVEVA